LFGWGDRRRGRGESNYNKNRAITTKTETKNNWLCINHFSSENNSVHEDLRGKVEVLSVVVVVDVGVVDVDVVVAGMIKESLERRPFCS